MCTDTASPAKPHAQAIADIVDRNLKAARVSAKVRNDLQDQIDQVEFVDGQVAAVATKANSRMISIASRESTKHAEFEFPPNSARFEEELLRAQSDGRVVSVVYRRQAGDVLMVESVWVYAGVANSSPRY